MWVHALGIMGLAVACGGWVLLQRWIRRRDPGQPGVEGRCGSCGKTSSCEGDKPLHVR